MKKFLFILIIVLINTIIIFSQASINDRNIKFIETKIKDSNQMSLYSFNNKINPSVLVDFMRLRKSEYKGTGFYYCVIFDLKDNAKFPDSPFTAMYGMEEDSMRHIRDIYTFNKNNGYSILNIYEKNMWDSKPVEYKVQDEIINGQPVSDNTQDQTEYDGSSQGIMILLMIGLMIFLFFPFRSYFKRKKFKKLYFPSEANLSNIIQYKGFLGASESKVVYADKKYKLVYDYIYNDILDNNVDNNFSMLIANIMKNKKFAGFIKYIEKMKLCSKYPQFKHNILSRSICVNMPYELLIFLFGQPGDTKEQVLKNKIKKQFFYHGVLTNRNTIKYKLRVDIEDGLITGWKDL